MHLLKAEDVLRRAETPLFWVGEFTIASLSLWLARRRFAMMVISRSQDKLDGEHCCTAIFWSFQ
uniref:Uncharacterized protein n=1 Tax=Oncorhynchus tshawytscha TaxID=74940 RepID=A0AAZ3QRQ2_ONCTS